MQRKPHTAAASCRKWLQGRKDEAEQAEEAAARAREAVAQVGPQLPAANDSGAGHEGSYGINLRPGEGERCVQHLSRDCAMLSVCCVRR
jgi:hypothetical protein